MKKQQLVRILVSVVLGIGLVAGVAFAVSDAQAATIGGHIIGMGMCIHSSETGVQLKNCWGTAAQEFRITGNGQIRVGYNDCLDTYYSNGKNRIYAPTCNSSNSNQSWKFVDMTIRSGMDARKCLDVDLVDPPPTPDECDQNWLEDLVGGGDPCKYIGDNTARLKTCSSSRDHAQLWDYDPVTQTIRDGDVCLNAGRTVNGSPVIGYKCHGGIQQKWIPDGRGGFQTARNLNKCLDVSGDTTAEGTKLVINTCDGTDSQRWALHGTIQNGRTNECLDIPVTGTTVSSGQTLVTHKCHGKINQQWFFWLPDMDS